MLCLSCQSGHRDTLVTVHRTPLPGGQVRLTLVGAPGARINARLKPALELPDGKVLRFEDGPVDPDSSYFSGSPSLVLTGDPTGTVAASICPAGEGVCRSIRVAVK